MSRQGLETSIAYSIFYKSQTNFPFSTEPFFFIYATIWIKGMSLHYTLYYDLQPVSRLVKIDFRRWLLTFSEIKEIACTSSRIFNPCFSYGCLLEQYICRCMWLPQLSKRTPKISFDHWPGSIYFCNIFIHYLLKKLWLLWENSLTVVLHAKSSLSIDLSLWPQSQIIIQWLLEWHPLVDVQSISASTNYMDDWIRALLMVKAEKVVWRYEILYVQCRVVKVVACTSHVRGGS